MLTLWLQYCQVFTFFWRCSRQNLESLCLCSLCIFGSYGHYASYFPLLLCPQERRRVLWWGCMYVCLSACAHRHTHTTVLQPTWILSGTTHVSRHQKGKTSLDLLEKEIVSGNGISWVICKSHLDPDVTTPASHHSVFTGRMPFLPPNHQRQITEGLSACISQKSCGRTLPVFLVVAMDRSSFGSIPIYYVLQFCGWRHFFTTSV